jgi:hypothetical protein
MRTQPVTERSAWRAEELVADPTWQHALSGHEIEEIEGAARKVLAAGHAACEFQREDFPLPTLGPRIEALVDEVENGRGVALLRGIPVQRFDDDMLRALYWGFAVHAATPISQNSKGQLMAEVSDRGNDYGYVNTRGFSTNAELYPHVDTSDMTTLLCVRQARRGGVSKVISSTSVYNAVLAEHPEYLEVLYRGFYNDLRGEGPTGDINELTEERVPVFSYHEGRVSCSFNYRMIEGASNKSGVPLERLERAALDFVREVSLREALTHSFTMQPGDIQMVSNHSVFHSRTGFEDHPEPERRRCLLRCWMNIRNGRALEPRFANRYNTGPRGGVAVGDGARYVF